MAARALAAVAEVEVVPGQEADGARWLINRRLLAAAIVTALAAAGLAIYVAGHPLIQVDVTVERFIQSTSWGPLALAFPFLSWIGDAKGFFLELIIFVATLAWNRRAWVFAATAPLTVVWYLLLIQLIHRPRPTTAQVLQVTEHLGASSFPSGHTIFMVTVVAMAVLCLGYRFLHGWGRTAGWIAGGLVVIAGAIDRIYAGAHWPTDVIAGILIATAWLTFVLSLRWISSRVLDQSST